MYLFCCYVSKTQSIKIFFTSSSFLTPSLSPYPTSCTSPLFWFLYSSTRFFFFSSFSPLFLFFLYFSLEIISFVYSYLPLNITCHFLLLPGLLLAVPLSTPTVLPVLIAPRFYIYLLTPFRSPFLPIPFLLFSFLLLLVSLPGCY
jgi:hypothetical protein